MSGLIVFITDADVYRWFKVADAVLTDPHGFCRKHAHAETFT